LYLDKFLLSYPLPEIRAVRWRNEAAATKKCEIEVQSWRWVSCIGDQEKTSSTLQGMIIRRYGCWAWRSHSHLIIITRNCAIKKSKLFNICSGFIFIIFRRN